MGPISAWIAVKNRFHNTSVKTAPEEGDLPSILRSGEFIPHLCDQHLMELSHSA